MKNPNPTSKNFVATRNACKLCAPLGASVAYKGIQGCVALIHGSQGCATYVRRYLISHYKEPVDIASSGFNEEATIFGGSATLKVALHNVDTQYKPELIGISTTCLSETIGDDVPAILREFTHETPCQAELVHAATPSYCGSHVDGFHQAVLAVLQQFALPQAPYNDALVLLPGFLSPADYAHLREIFEQMHQQLIVLPDIALSLDNPTWPAYTRMPQGGTPLHEIRTIGGAKAYLQLGTVLNMALVNGSTRGTSRSLSPGLWLEEEFSMPGRSTTIPIGVRATDAFFAAIEQLCAKPIPAMYQLERGRLIDAYADGHKYVFGKRAIVYGEEDFVLALTAFLLEIGIHPVVVASGAESGRLAAELEQLMPADTLFRPTIAAENADFEQLATWARELKPDLLIGHSKGYYIARELGIPLVRVGFPIHDRLGGQRLLHVGYRGTHRLFEAIANAIIEHKQHNSPVGYKYM